MTADDETTTAEPDSSIAAAPVSRRWITAEYDDDGFFQVRAHADEGFGGRSAAVHVDIPNPPAELATMLGKLLDDADVDLEERAQDAVSEHRTMARNRGEDHRAALAYVGPEVSADEGVYSSAHVMELPADEREAAIKEGR